MPKEYLCSLEGIILESDWQGCVCVCAHALVCKHLVFVCKYVSSEGNLL